MRTQPVGCGQAVATPSTALRSFPAPSLSPVTHRTPRVRPGLRARCIAEDSEPLRPAPEGKSPHMRLPGAGMSPDFRHYQTTIQSTASRSSFPHCHFDHDAAFVTHRSQGPCPLAPLHTDPSDPPPDLSALTTFLTFQLMAQQPDPSLHPLHCALLIARMTHSFSPQHCLDTVAAMAQEVTEKLRSRQTPPTETAKLQAINEVLYQDYGFKPLHDATRPPTPSDPTTADATPLSPPTLLTSTAPTTPTTSTPSPTPLSILGPLSEEPIPTSFSQLQPPGLNPPGVFGSQGGSSPPHAPQEHGMYLPDSNLLNRVLELRTGSPTAMAILYLALADAVGLSLEPVLMRSHMYLASRGNQGPHVIDPYCYGRLRTRADVARDLAANKVYVAGCLEAETEGGPGATPWPIGCRADVVLRLLLNLRETFWAPLLRCQYAGSDVLQRMKQVERALVVLRLARVVGGDLHPGLMCDEGLALVMLGREEEGLPLLSRYLSRCPDSSDAAMVRQMLQHFSSQSP